MKKRKTVFVALGSLTAALCLGAGIWAGLRYWTGEDFVPGESDRALRKNQVLFQQEPDPQATADQDGGEDSARWEKDLQAESQDSPQLDQNGNFLFRTDNSQLSGSTGGILDENGQPAGDGGELPDHIFTPGDGGGGSIGGGGTGATEERPTEPTRPPIPHFPGDPVDKPSSSAEETYREPEGETSWTNWNFYVSPTYDSIYVGQELTTENIFARLRVSFTHFDPDTFGFDFYYLNKEQYGTYFRITAISFDDGKSWVTEFPVTVPEDAGNIQIETEYRFSANGSWQKELLPDYGTPKQSCVYVLSRLPGDDEEYLDPSCVLNYDRVSGGSTNPEPGKSYNLLGFLKEQLYLEDSGNTVDEPLRNLFTGWMENGEQVSWLYPVTKGRHMLYPGGYTACPAGYTIQGKQHLVTLDTLVIDKDGTAPESVYCFFQELTDAPVGTDGVLKVPEYVQCVDMDGLQADTLRLSDTVILVHGNSANIGKFLVDGGNPYYSGCKTGPLAGAVLSKDGSALYAVPGDPESLTLPDSIRTVYPLDGKMIRSLTLETKNAAHIPQLDKSLYENLESIQTENLSVLIALCESNLARLEATPGLELHCAELPDVSFSVQDGCLVGQVGQDAAVYRLLLSDAITLSLSKEMHSLAANACEDRENLRVLVLPADGTEVTLGKDSLKGTGLSKIYYATPAQKASVEAQLAYAGVTWDVSLEPLAQSGGVTYMPLEDGTVRLLRAPTNLTEFDGAAWEAESGKTIGSIGNGCFEGCHTLRWVTLGSSAAEVERNAFRNCTALEGILMEATGPVKLEDNCLDGCTALRMGGINSDSVEAPASLSGSGAIPGIIWCRGGSNLGENWGTVSGSSGFAWGMLGSDARVLYGQQNGVNTWLLGASAVLPASVALDPNTFEITVNTFRNCRGENGSFTINWDALENLWYIDQSAFDGSQLTGTVQLRAWGAYGSSVTIGSYAFRGSKITALDTSYPFTTSFGMEAFTKCAELTEVTLGDIQGDERLPALPFGSCPKLEVIHITADTPPKLIQFSLSYRSPYLFGPEELNANFHLDVPDDRKQTYYDAWRFPMTGYQDYESMKQVLKCRDTGTSDQLEKELLEGSNHLRRLMGMEELTSLDDFFPYVVNDGVTTLTGAPAGVREVELSTTGVGMDADYQLNYIGSGAFSRCAQLETVSVTQALDGFYPDAFAGSGLKNLVFDVAAIPELMVTPGEPFTFGNDDRLRLTVPDGFELSFVQEWRCPMVGFADEEALRQALEKTCQDQEALETAVRQKLLEGENKVRRLLGMEAVEEPTENYVLEQDGFATVLVRVPKNVETVNLGEEIQGQYVTRIAANAFRDAEKLQKVIFTEPVSFIPVQIEPDAFAGTDGVTIQVQGSTMPELVSKNDGVNFYFGGSNLHIQVDDPNACLESWKYPFAGYFDSWIMYMYGQNENDFVNSRSKLEAALLQGENTVREMLGMAQVSAPSGFYQIGQNGIFLTLTRAPWDATEVSLDEYSLNLPNGWALDYIGSGAFANCPSLSRVTIPATLAGIESGAFAQENLTLVFEGEEPPYLMADWGAEFTFGVENLTIQVPEGCKETYLNAWKDQIFGSLDLEEQKEQMMARNGWNALRAEQEAKALQVQKENDLRKALGMELLPDPLTHFTYTAVRNGIRLEGVPTYVENITLDETTMGTEPGTKLLEINADAFRNCDVLKKVVLPDTVDAITAKAFTCATDGMTLDMTAWTKDKTPPTLVLLDNEPFTFGLTKGDEKLEIRVANEEVKQRFVEAWAPFFAGAESKDALVEKLSQAYLTAEKTELTQEEQQAVTAEAENLLSQARAALNERITYYIPENEDTGIAEETER